VESKPASSLVVSLGNTLKGMHLPFEWLNYSLRFIAYTIYFILWYVFLKKNNNNKLLQLLTAAARLEDRKGHFTVSWSEVS